MPEYLARYVGCAGCGRKAEYTMVIDDKFSYYCEECVRKMILSKYSYLTTATMTTDELMLIFNCVGKQKS